jgi:glycerol-3-phosphate dehydrogenase (NAD(P)+)
MKKVVIVGTTAWGTTLCVLLARKGETAWLLARSEFEAHSLNTDMENKKRLPGVAFPDGLEATSILERAFASAELVIVAVPSQTMRENARLIAPHLNEKMIVVSATKGLEIGTGLRMSQVLAEELPDDVSGHICVLSGPNLSGEIVQGLAAASVVAGEDLIVAEKAQELLMTSTFRVYTNSDVVGIEMGGALKNIIALGVGMGDGLGYGHNAKAAFMTRGLAEMARLGVAAGANPLTFSGLAGLGDLVATCSSPLSRNRHVGEQLAKGYVLSEIAQTLGHVAEGVPTTAAACELARTLNVEMPITEQMYRVLFDGFDLEQAIAELMGREAKHELAGIIGIGEQ